MQQFLAAIVSNRDRAVQHSQFQTRELYSNPPTTGTISALSQIHPQSSVRHAVQRFSHMSQKYMCLICRYSEMPQKYQYLICRYFQMHPKYMYSVYKYSQVPPKYQYLIYKYSQMHLKQMYLILIESHELGTCASIKNNKYSQMPPIHIYLIEVHVVDLEVPPKYMS